MTMWLLILALIYKLSILNSSIFANNDEIALFIVCISFLYYIIDHSKDKKVVQKNIVSGGDVIGGDLIK